MSRYDLTMAQNIPDVVIDTVVHKQVAMMVLTNVPLKDIADRLGVSQYILRKILGSEEFKTCLADIADEAVNQAVRVCKADMVDLMREAIRVLRHNLETNNLQAAITVFKLSGLMDQANNKPSDNGPTAINVILPGARPEKLVPST